MFGALTGVLLLGIISNILTLSLGRFVLGRRVVRGVILVALILAKLTGGGSGEDVTRV